MITFKTMTWLITLLLLSFTGFVLIQNENDSKSSLSGTEYDIEVEVNGLHCSICVRNCERSLKKMEQVETAVVQLEEGLALIKLKPEQTITKEQIIEAIQNAGFQSGEFKKFPGDNRAKQE